MASMGRIERLPAQRHAAILERIRARGAASIQQLVDDLGVSSSTIRRDLDALTEQGYLERTHGGALLQRTLRATFEPDAATAAALAAVQKRAIGTEAVRRLNPGDSIIFDAGSTVLEAARALVSNPVPLTAVTNGLAIATVLSGVPSVRVLLLGGTVRPHSTAILGEPGESFLRGIHADLCLLGTHAISGSMLTETTLEGAALKRAMIRAAKRTVLLADSSKLQSPAFCSICELSEISELIIDDGIDDGDLRALRSYGLAVHVAPTSGLRGNGSAAAAG